MAEGSGKKLNQPPVPLKGRLRFNHYYLYGIIQMLKWKMESLELYLSTAPSPNGEGDGG